MIKYILLSLLLIPNICFGDVILHLRAYHPTNESLNNNVYGIGYRVDNTHVGVYRNSIDRNSLYLLKSKQMFKNIEYFYGIASGYFNIPTPIGGVNITKGKLSLTIVPPVGKYAETALMLSIKVY